MPAGQVSMRDSESRPPRPVIVGALCCPHASPSPARWPGEDVVRSYLRLKHDDWNAYARHLTEWERETTLDC